MVDVLITIGIIVFVLLRAYSKSKRRSQKRSPNKPYTPPFPQTKVESEPIWETLEESFQDDEVKMTTSYEETPKNDTYFTYESLEPDINEGTQAKDSSSVKDVENSVQNIEGENENSLQISFGKEELMKGVIYSEILKNPYNQ